MRKKGFTLIELMIALAIIGLLCALILPRACHSMGSAPPPRTDTGVKKATVRVVTQSSGLTIEQENIANRLKEDNKIGSIKHLYVISAYSGQVLIYSTVKGKVTSSGKRLNPYQVSILDGGNSRALYGFSINTDDGSRHETAEVLQDDGTYGSSSEYIYWWDTKGIYHQHYIAGGQIVHVSNQPLAVKNIVINMELK